MSAAIVRGDALRIPLRDESVDLVVTSPPYFALRSYQDAGEHYSGQIGSEETPADFLRALWGVMDECWRVLKPTGVVFVNLGDKYAGSGGHNNAGISRHGTGSSIERRTALAAMSGLPAPVRVKLRGDRAREVGGGGHERRAEQRDASRRNAPDRYNQSADVRPKSVMGLPWRFALGCSCPDPYRTCYQPGEHPQWLNRRPMIWHKPNGLPESVSDRCRANFEDWFMLTKEGAYHADLDSLRTPQLSLGRGRPFTTEVEGSVPTWGVESGSQGLRGKRSTDQMNALNPKGALPGSVWTIATEPLIVPEHVGTDHFAAFPQEWPRRLILGWCPPQGVVLDPFGGTGTTAMVARALGRFGISLDLSADYLRLARWRIFESGHAGKSRERTNREAQGSLLGGAA